MIILWYLFIIFVQYPVNNTVDDITVYPTVVFLDANGQERADLRLLGYENAPAFIRRLSSLSGNP